MTLFRKVFQTQARPATAGEAPDEISLRKAFRELAPEAGPLLLDPFSQVKRIEETIEESDHFCPVTDPISALKREAEEEGDWRYGENLDAEASEETEALTEIEDVDEIEEHDVIETEDDDQSAAVAGIAAALRRTEAAPQLRDEAPEPADVAAFDDIDPGTDTGDFEEEVQATPEVADNAAQDAKTVAPDVATDEAVLADRAPLRAAPDVPEPAAEALDLAAFAQQQMQALNATQGPVAPRRPEPLDLSKAGLEGLPAPAEGRVSRRAGRVKTRLLGFNQQDREAIDPLSAAAETTATAQREKFPVGWLVVVEGPGVGHSFSLFSGASMIGRGEDQVIRLDFGDTSISRQNHAAIAYDEEQNKFYLGHGGKSNIIRRNARPVLSTEELHHADLIRVGETTLRFVALCGSDFQWNTVDAAHASGL
jgi:hypothetical protein